MMHSFSVCCAGDAAAAPTSRRLTWSAVAIASSGVATGCRGGGAVHKKSVIINARKKPKFAASVAFVFQVFGSAARKDYDCGKCGSNLHRNWTCFTRALNTCRSTELLLLLPCSLPQRSTVAMLGHFWLLFIMTIKIGATLCGNCCCCC